jgi:UDP-N-acetyl-D-glucosamine dehydrogenase
MGLAYKANVDDMRESPTFHLMDLLESRGASVAYFDPHIPVITPTREHARWTGMKSIQWNRKSVAAFDAVVIATHHARFDLASLARWADCIIDTRNAMANVSTRPGQVTKA